MAGIITNVKSRTVLTSYEEICIMHKADYVREHFGTVWRKVAIFLHDRYYMYLIEQYSYAKAFSKFAYNNDPIIFHCGMLLARGELTNLCFPVNFTK